MLRKEFEKIIHLLKKEIIAYYDDRLVSIVLFGSVARETYRHDSDIDLLLIVEGLQKGRVKRVDEFIKNIEDKLEDDLGKLRSKGLFIDISPVIKTPDEALSGSPLFLDMVEDARVLYDRGDFFKKLIEKLKKRLEQLGAKRIWRANSWYWDLKPEYKAGEVIDL